MVDIRRHLDLAFEQGDRVADRYVIERLVGRGGMGVVYRAHDTLVDEPVALKFMLPQLLSTEKGQKMFIAEAQIARRLRHDNIAAVHDVSWTSDGILYLSMEFLEGRSLRSMLRQQRQDRKLIEIRLVVSYIRQMLAALENAHRLVIHRDIKPENVMLLSNEQLKVLDFGLAKAIFEEIFKVEEPKEPGRVVGTLAYAAPEQRKRQPIDQRADIYAVGLVMRELLTLRTPMDEPAAVEKVRPDASPSLLAVLHRALKEEKEQRWQSAREFRAALDAAFEESYRRVSGVNIIVPSTQRTASTENMVHFDGGSFLMGSNEFREEAPEAEVKVGAFWMDIFPVTVAEYKRFMEETGAPMPRFWRDPNYNGPNQPVVGVSWEQANAYAAWAGKQLPTEAHWEFAARGRENRKYPWGNLPPDSTLCNFNDFLGMTSMVSMHEDGRTPEGIYDMAGNVNEWTLDYFLPYSKLRAGVNGIPDAPRRTVRGGAFDSKAHELTSTYRRGVFPESQVANVGFRCIIPE